MSILNLPLREVETQELSSTAASVTFSSINTKVPSGSRHLVILISGKTDSGQSNVLAQYNADTGANYSRQDLTASVASTSAASASGETSTRVGLVPGTGDLWGGGIILIPHFANALNHKAHLDLCGASENRVTVHTGRWANTAAITSIVLSLSNDDWAVGSRITLCVVDERYLIAESILSGADGGFSFTTIPAVEGDLVAVGYLRTNRAGTADGIDLDLNADTTDAHYARQLLEGNGSSASATAAADREIGIMPGNTAGSNNFGALAVSISAYNRSVNDPHVISISGYHQSAPSSRIDMYSGRRNDIEPLIRVDVTPDVGTNFKDGSMMSLYLVPKRKVERVVATGNVASYSFTPPSSGVEALQHTLYGRISTTAANEGVDTEFNADTTAANYDRQRLEGDGSTVTAAQSAAEQALFEVPAASATGLVFGGGSMLVVAHTKTDRHKHRLYIGGPADDVVQISSGRWENTAAITSVVHKPETGGENFLSGTVIEQSSVPANGQDVTDRTRSTKTV